MPEPEQSHGRMAYITPGDSVILGINHIQPAVQFGGPMGPEEPAPTIENVNISDDLTLCLVMKASDVLMGFDTPLETKDVTMYFANPQVALDLIKGALEMMLDREGVMRVGMMMMQELARVQAEDKDPHVLAEFMTARLNRMLADDELAQKEGPDAPEDSEG